MSKVENLEFEDRANNTAEYPRLVSKKPIVLPGSGSISVERSKVIIKLGFDGKKGYNERVFNSIQQVSQYLDLKLKNFKGSGEVILEIGYHYSREKIHLEIFRHFLTYHTGEFIFFDTIKEVEDFIKIRYKRNIIIPEEARNKFKKNN